MNESNSLSMACLGRIQNGVVVFDAPTPFSEGQTVRIESIRENAARSGELDPDDRDRRLEALFAEWDAEDARLPDEEADLLGDALAQSKRLRFRTPDID